MGTAAVILICSLAASPCGQSRSADAFPPLTQPINWHGVHDPVFRTAMDSAEHLNAVGLDCGAEQIRNGFVLHQNFWNYKQPDSTTLERVPYIFAPK